MIPAVNALLSLLILKLHDKERLSHIDDFNCDEALDLFAGLNILPKKSFATDYSYRTIRDNQVFCCSNANLTRSQQSGQIFCFMDFWRKLMGKYPQWLYFDSKLTTYEELSQIAQVSGSTGSPSHFGSLK